MSKISVIVPCYNEEEALPVYYREMCKIMDAMQAERGVEFELLFVDDGSSDHTLSVMKELHEKDSRCRYYSFSRNFGKEAAMYAGLSYAIGEYAAIMDVDLQDPPSLLPKMYDILQSEPYDSVATRRETRVGEPRVRSFLAECFYKLINRISDTEMVSGARDYRLMSRNMVDAVLTMSEYNRFSKGIFEWVGFRTKWLSYENVERAAGETKWSVTKLFRYAMEAITGFSVAPLFLSMVAGIFFLAVSLAMALVIAAKTLVLGEAVPGFMILVCALFLVGSIQLICVGILGEYLSRTYLETKHRPIFILRDSSEEKTESNEKQRITAVQRNKKRSICA